MRITDTLKQEVADGDAIISVWRVQEIIDRSYACYKYDMSRREARQILADLSKNACPEVGINMGMIDAHIQTHLEVQINE
jgi:nanoRNase/pAp phosphatase (c-di-AMP/oligoRNAs hydrolase)